MIDIDEISIRPPRAGRDRQLHVFVPPVGISIRPPRAGRDDKPHSTKGQKNISIRPPRAGRDKAAKIIASERANFNPPAPCGAGRYKAA